jgi:uncharacterized protein (DUF427 family)
MTGNSDAARQYFCGNRISENATLLEPCTHSSVCPWKGTANCYSLKVDDHRNANAAWYYAAPKAAAAQIKGRVAFWKGVSVVE